jgi:hypothetical protein
VVALADLSAADPAPAERERAEEYDQSGQDRERSRW